MSFSSLSLSFRNPIISFCWVSTCISNCFNRDQIEFPSFKSVEENFCKKAILNIEGERFGKFVQRTYKEQRDRFSAKRSVFEIIGENGRFSSALYPLNKGMLVLWYQISIKFSTDFYILLTLLLKVQGRCLPSCCWFARWATV